MTGKTRGSNRLIKEGARLVECVEDVLEELLPQLGEAAKRSDIEASGESAATAGKAFEAQTFEHETGEVQSLLLHLKNGDKLHVDALIEGCGLNAQTVLKLMLELELRGLVMQHPGKLFSLA